MNQLRYVSMKVNDFKSIKELRFDFPTAPGLYFIKGENRVEPQLESNGCGKSTIYDALCWLQFGKTPDGLRTPDLVPWDGEKKPSGALLAYINNEEFLLARHTTGALLNGHEATQEHIERELGLGFETFIHTILVPQNHELFLERKRGEKLGLLSEAIQLDRWDRRAEAASASAHKLQNKAHEEHGRIDGMTRQLRELRELRNSVRDQSREWDEEQQQREGEKEKETASLQKQLDSMQAKYDKASIDYDGAMTELEALQAETRQLADYMNINDLEIIEGKQGVESAKREYAEIEKQLNSLVKGKCPTCGQKVHKSLPKRQELQARLLELDDPCSPDSLQALHSTKEDLKRQYTTLWESEKAFKAKAQQAESIINLHRDPISKLHAKLESLQQKPENNPFREQRKQLRRRYEQLEIELKKKTAEWRENLAACERLEFWSRAYRDIKLDIVKELLEQLQMCCNLNLPQAGLVGWQLQFDIERENKSGGTSRGIDVRVLPHGREPSKHTKFENWSGGEAQRLSLIATLALSEVLLARAGVEPNLQIFDEPTQHLSSAGVYDLVECLAEWAHRKGRTVLLADQIALESSSFAGTIHVERGTGGTALVQ